jgi:hypothetical protein
VNFLGPPGGGGLVLLGVGYLDDLVGGVVEGVEIVAAIVAIRIAFVKDNGVGSDIWV